MSWIWWEVRLSRAVEEVTGLRLSHEARSQTCVCALLDVFDARQRPVVWFAAESGVCVCVCVCVCGYGL